jgi:hypothetical protein
MGKRHAYLYNAECGVAVMDRCIESGRANLLYKAGTYREASRWVHDQHRESVQNNGPKWAMHVRV